MMLKDRGRHDKSFVESDEHENLVKDSKILTTECLNDACIEY